MRFLLFVAGFLLFTLQCNAQTVEEAKALFNGKNYVAAAEMYSRLYLFEEAVEAYQTQIALLKKNRKSKPEDIEAIEPLLNQAERLAKMVARCENVQIIDSVIVNKNDFLNAYLLGEEAGTLENTKGSVNFENQLKDRRYFGKKTSDGNFRLHTQTKIQDVWTEEKILNLPSDSTSDDNFPFVMPDGLTIYYASTGNGSIGGYDIFVSRYNLTNDTYLAPNQFGMPFNSIYNDYMMAVDEVNEIGYFATDRFQPEDKVVIYTFIPNNEYTSVESEDEQELIGRALITSIQDTWVQGKDYQAYLNTIKSSIENERQKIQKDFTFVINDNIVYYALTDFDSDAAKNAFLQSQAIRDKIMVLENQLDIHRQNYAKGDASKKQSLKEPILANEKQLENWYEEYEKAIRNTRNLEIKYLRQKQ
jgi:hypothetical protein